MRSRAEILSVEAIETRLSTAKGAARVVDRVSFTVRAGETLAIVGESGCGKSMLALSVLRLLPPPATIVGGHVLFGGRDLLALPEREMRHVRGGKIAMVFQEPMSSLNPVLRIGDQIREMLCAHRKVSREAATARMRQLLKLVRIPDPDRLMNEFPHRLSGGMRQRAMIAMALACEPELLIADEPTTALDVTVQAQILELLRQIKEELGLAILLITHNLGVVAENADRVLVMYAGRKVEEGTVEDLFLRPKHPYTRGLLRALPNPRRELDDQPLPLQEIPGAVPPLHAMPGGCAFASRCAQAVAECTLRVPEILPVSDSQAVACFVAQNGLRGAARC